MWKPQPYYDEDTGYTLFLLNGLRITSSVLTSLMWAADVTGNLVPSYNVSVLDATLVFTLDWERPVVGVPYECFVQ